MQFSPINSLNTSEDIRKTQNTSSFVSNTSACSLPLVSAGNTNENPLTLSSNQAIATSEYSTYLHADICTSLFEEIYFVSKEPYEIDSIIQSECERNANKQAQDYAVTEISSQETDVWNTNGLLDDIDILNIPSSSFDTGMRDTHHESFASDILDDLLDTHSYPYVATTAATALQEDINLEVQDHLDTHSYPYAATAATTVATAASDLQEDINLEVQESTQSNENNNTESILENALQRDNTEIELQNSNISSAANINTEILQQSIQLTDELMLKFFLLNVLKENFENYEQVVFKAYVENNHLKEKYLELCLTALKIKNECKQIKTQIAHLGNYDVQNTSPQKNNLYNKLANTLMNYSRYHQLVDELKPHEIQTPVKISAFKMRKINKKVADKIQILEKRNLRSQWNYDKVLTQKQIIEPLLIQEMFCYLTEQRPIRIFKIRFSNLSIDRIKEIILSTKYVLQTKDNTDIKTISTELQEGIESDEVIMLEFLLQNIFTVPFFYNEQILFKMHEEKHPLKDKYLSLMISSLKSQNAYLHIKTRIIQLEHLKQEKNNSTQSVKVVKTILSKDLTELFINSTSYYQLMKELKPSKKKVKNKISAIKMKKINTTLINQIRTLQNQFNNTKRYYNKILNKKRIITENQIIQNIFHYLTEGKAIEIIQKSFTTLSRDKIKEIITDTKVIPPIKENKKTKKVTEPLLTKSESEEVSTLESLLLSLFKESFYYNEQILFNAYLKDIDLKEDFSTLAISAMQAKRACLQIKIRIAQLVKFKQKETLRACEISAVKKYLYEDLTDLLINSSNYKQLVDKLQPSIAEMQLHKNKHISSNKLRAINKNMADLNDEKKVQLSQTQKHFNEMIMDKQVTENQIIHNLFFYLSEPEAIKTIKKRFTSLTEDKIKETLSRSVLQIAQNQNKEESSTEGSNQKRKNDNLSKRIAPPTKKKRIGKSKASASLALFESAAFPQSPSQAGALRFSSLQSETLIERESNQSTEIHFPAQSLQSKPAQEEMEYAQPNQTNTIPSNISFSTLFFELEDLTEDLDISTIQLIDYQ